MKPLEAYSVISQCMNELNQMRKALYPKGRGYSQREIEAQVITFEALRSIDEDTIPVKYIRKWFKEHYRTDACALVEDWKSGRDMD